MDNSKNIFVLGCTGAGKSFLLNLLLGYDEPDNVNCPFKVGIVNESCTQECQFLQGSLYGQNKIQINVIDMPGLFDTGDKKDYKYKNNDMPPSITHLVGLQNVIEQKFQRQVHRVLLCIDVNRLWDETAKSIIKIADILMPSKQKVSVIITKCNSIRKIQKQSKRDAWVKALAQDGGIEQVYFFEDTLDTVDGRFEESLRHSVEEQMRNWNDLTKNEKNSIGGCFNYVVTDQCFSLDMLVTLQDGQQVNCRSLNKSQLLSHNQNSNHFLGFIHVDQNVLTEFYQFTTDDNKILECTKSHLICCVKKQNGKVIQQFIKASEVQIGDYLLQSKQDQDKLITFPIKVRLRKVVYKNGFWCPLTSNGIIIVNQFLVSSYSSVSQIVTQEFAHIAMKPLIYYRQLFGFQKQLEQEKLYSQYAKFGEWLFIKN
ncbi:Hint module [Paramecium bursaria]